MIVIKFSGGLGNQMFQYAFAFKHFLMGKAIKADLTFYKSSRCHQGYELSKVFNIAIQEATNRDILYFISKKKSGEGETNYELKENRFFFNEVQSDNEFRYLPQLLQLDDTYFSGYWQHQRYFKDIALQLREKFVFSVIPENDVQNKDTLEKIQYVNSVAIHIRRGDYLNSDTYLKLSKEYYEKSIDYFREQIPNPKFFVFSDDPLWAKENLIMDDPCYIDWNGNQNSFRDMQLMSNCKHNIIANSTFSWWAAWLNANPEKKIVTPPQWFSDNRYVGGLLLKNWVQVSDTHLELTKKAE